MAIYEKLTDVGLSFAGEILKRLNNGDDVNMTAVILTDVIGKRRRKNGYD